MVVPDHKLNGKPVAECLTERALLLEVGENGDSIFQKKQKQGSWNIIDVTQTVSEWAVALRSLPPRVFVFMCQ